MTLHTPLADETDRTKVTAGEVPFATDELFFSRTDERGVIATFNEVFRRVSGYEGSELSGAPHKMVRHPDMPRAVFHKLWSELKARRPVGAYIKNRAKDGRHYWVFAVVMPVYDGYMSIRLKPLSGQREKIEALYHAIRQAELTDNQSAEAGRPALDAGIQELGFTSYEIFQSETLATELQARQEALGRPLDPRLQRFLAMSRAMHQIEAESEAMMRAFEAIRTIPINMRILASRLENAGGPISAISVNYGSMSDEMASWVRTFVQGEDSAFSRIRFAIVNGLFMNSISQLTLEMEDFYLEEHRGDADMTAETKANTLSGLKKHYAERAAEDLKNVEVEAGRLSRSVLDMKRFITGLSSTRMMCKIESATLSKSGETLVGIVDQLDASQDGIEEHLARISELNHLVQANTGMLRTGHG